MFNRIKNGPYFQVHKKKKQLKMTLLTFLHFTLIYDRNTGSKQKMGMRNESLENLIIEKNLMYFFDKKTRNARLNEMM